eukprot:1201853-Pleurochrysis_carterae.AAC.2
MNDFFDTCSVAHIFACLGYLLRLAFMQILLIDRALSNALADACLKLCCVGRTALLKMPTMGKGRTTRVLGNLRPRRNFADGQACPLIALVVSRRHWRKTSSIEDRAARKSNK